MDQHSNVYEDKGCSYATDFLQAQARALKRKSSDINSKCTDCPFILCFHDNLSKSDRILLNRAVMFKSLYKCLDEERMPRKKILKLFKMSEPTLIYWIRNREKIMSRLDMLQKELVNEHHKLELVAV